MTENNGVVIWIKTQRVVSGNLRLLNAPARQQNLCHRELRGRTVGLYLDGTRCHLVRSIERAAVARRPSAAGELIIAEIESCELDEDADEGLFVGGRVFKAIP